MYRVETFYNNTCVNLLAGLCLSSSSSPSPLLLSPPLLLLLLLSCMHVQSRDLLQQHLGKPAGRIMSVILVVAVAVAVVVVVVVVVVMYVCMSRDLRQHLG